MDMRQCNRRNLIHWSECLARHRAIFSGKRRKPSAFENILAMPGEAV
jgi:hypothetical protein